MKNLFYKMAAFVLVCWLPGSIAIAQVCNNVSLSLDGNADFVQLSPTPAAVSGNANFTFEARFTIANPTLPCTSNFRRLFALGGSVAPVTRFEVGECNGILRLYWSHATLGAIPTGVTAIGTTISPGCHHLAVVRNGTALQFYLDGVLIPFAGTLTVPLNTNIFRVGHWGGGATPGQDWQGEVDEIRLWNVPRTATQINDFKDCSLSGIGSAASLIVNWSCDQPGVTPGGNNTGATLTDMSGNGNNGTFSTAAANGILLNGTGSNFICSACSPFYSLAVTDLANQSTLLTAICSGEDAHFCVTQNGALVSPPPGATVMWEYFDGNSTVPTSLSSPFTGFCFGVPVIDISAICATSSTGFVNRKYRAKITKTVGGLTCTFYTSIYPLLIYCPVTNGSVVLTTTPPVPAGGALCEGTNTVNVSLNSTHPYVVPPAITPNGAVSIQWCVNGTPDAAFNNMTSFVWTNTAAPPNLCFEAKITNGVCPQYTTQTCVFVDPQPMCGLITGKPVPATLMPDPDGNPDHYLICPGQDATIGMVNPNDFIGCNPVWQYHFDTDLPGVWYDLLGTSNPCQNTNILPQTNPPNPSTSPYLWPAGANCIFYRIECRPYHYSPYSACTPCTSNVVRICLKPQPPNYAISGSATQFCAGGSFSTLNIVPAPPGSAVINWYWNGLQVIAGGISTYLASQEGCYWATIFDGCYTVTTPKFCVEACEVVPIILCPSDNPCGCAGQPITLDGCSSYYTCSNTGPLPLIYSWSASNSGAGTQTGANGCQFIHTPSPGGTTYTLTITDPNLGCVGMTTFYYKPCL